jgi:hypothetical protein
MSSRRFGTAETMIRAILVQVTRNRHGQPIRTERAIAGDILRIGRGAECAIHLPDYSVRLRHAAIRDTEGGRYVIEGENSPISVNGSFHSGAELTPGTRVAIGPYELLAESPGPDGELVISLELVRPHPQEKTLLARAPTTLAAAGLSKRTAAIWLALPILVICLLLPALQAASPSVRQALARVPALAPVTAWSPGPLLPGHQAFATQCSKCHRDAFAAVSDAACTECHRKTTPHAQDVAAPRCAECHRDHKNEAGLVRGDHALCVSCHGDIKRHKATSTLANISDFTDDHPGFRLSFQDARGARRVLQSEKAAVEKSGLKFSHKAHHGKVRLPTEPPTFRNVDCGDCHQSDSGAWRFRPVSMKRHCFECHKEEFDFNPPQEGHRLPHGSERAVMDMLSHFYLGKALEAEAAPGGRKSAARLSAQQALAAATAKARQTADALGGDMGCGYCHEVEDAEGDAAPAWKVKPPALTERWLPASRFRHDKHAAEKCTECHDVTRSRKSADVAIPNLQKCRECHGGEDVASGKVATACASCHSFHGAAPQAATRP